MNEPALEFVWVGDDAIDPLQQAQTLQILVGAGIKTPRGGAGGVGAWAVGGRVQRDRRSRSGALRARRWRKFNPHHNERGLFRTADESARHREQRNA